MPPRGRRGRGQPPAEQSSAGRGAPPFAAGRSAPASQDWRAAASFAESSSAGEAHRGGRYGGRGSYGGRGADSASGGRGYYGREQGYAPRGGGFVAEPQASGGRQDFREVQQGYSGRGAFGGEQQSWQSADRRGQGRAGRGRHRGGRWPAGNRDQRVETEGLGPSPPPPMTVLLPGMADLSINEPGPSTQVEEELSEIIRREDDAPGTIEPVAMSAPLELLSVSREVLYPPKRPQLGKQGSRAVVRVNHFLVKLRPGIQIYHYDVDINAKVISKSVNRRLQRQLLATHAKDFEGKYPVYDGSKSLYTVDPLPFENKEFEVVLSGDSREKAYKVTIRHVATLGSAALNEFLAGRKIATPQEVLQALDVAMREALMHPPYTPVGRSFFSKSLGSAPLDGGLTGWNGFFQSLRPTAQGLVLNVDIATTAFYSSIPVIEYLQKKFRQFNPQQKIMDAQRFQIKKALARLRVEVTHRPTPRKYRIYGLSQVSARDLKFSLNEGEEIGIVDYFRNTYNCIIRYPELPCLQVQATKATYLPMEVCTICEGQKYVGKLQENQTKDLRGLACVKPLERENKTKAIMTGATGPGRGEYVASFGMSVSTELTVVNARVLRPPKLRYGVQGHVREVDPRYGAWNMNNSCLVEGGTIYYWAFISFDRSINERLASEIIANLSHRCQELGIQMNSATMAPPYLGRREDLEGGHLERCLTTVCSRASQEMANKGLKGALQLLVCVLGEKHASYGELKRICETQLGVVTQCCLSKNIKRFNSQYLANVALKINAKVGGKNNTLAVELPDLCKTFKRPTMIFGADVTHPNPGDDSSPSIAALVANMDWPSAIQYVATVRAQPHREEMIGGLREMVLELWKKFCERTKVRPERIIMFRDGVSEGQFDRVLQSEVHALKEAMQVAGGLEYKPLITWVVVQKRHHTRLYSADSNTDKSGNVLPGTVVDSHITHPREFDFYLCSHAGIQGTSKPTHYYVLWDENSFTADELQGLINNLCYTYVRCTRSVSVVPPAYYAHLAASRARLYIEGQGGSDTASQSSRQPPSVASGGRSTRAAAPHVRPLPQIMRNVQDVMYFC